MNRIKMFCKYVFLMNITDLRLASMARKVIFIVVLIFAVLFASLAIFLFEPLFLRRRYIARISRLEIPSSVTIVDYRLGITEFGIEPFFAKVELSQEEHSSLRRYFSTTRYLERATEVFYRMQQDFNYTPESIGNITEILWRDRLTGRMSIFLAGTSRPIDMLLVATDGNEYFLYVFYGGTVGQFFRFIGWD